MKYIGSIFFIALLIGYFFVSCDKIEEPFLRNNIPDTGDTGTATVKRKILIEDYTGHKCPNCPFAAEVAKTIHEEHPDQVVVMAVHAGSFATPDASGNFTYDFRTPEGNQLNGDFGLGAAYPIGLISRITSAPGRWDVQYTKWAETVDTLLNDVATVKLTLTNNYVEANRTSNVTVKTDFLTDIEQNCFLCVYLTEDSIIKPQKKQNLTILDYIHMHVLRKSFNGTYGTQLNSAAGAAGATFTNSFSMNLSTDWVDKNCNIVVYVFREDTKEILQVETVKVK